MSDDFNLIEKKEQPTVPFINVETTKPTHQDQLRVRVTISLLMLFALILGFGLYLIYNERSEEAKLVNQMFLTPVLTLLSGVIGFYFGQKSK